MTATNHVVSGALVVAIIPNHWLALPLALLSHFILDALPHYGLDPVKNLKGFMIGFLVDVLLASSVLLAMLIGQPANFGWLIAGGILGASPDLLHIPYLISAVKHRHHHRWAINRFFSWIQWSETIMPGLPVEIIWFWLVGGALFNRVA